MISLNKFSFGSPENFVNAYLTEDLSQIVVIVQSALTVYPVIWSNEFLSYHDNTHLIFDIPDEFMNDIPLFMNGKYSRMSESAKDQIREHSGLNYETNVTTEQGTQIKRTDARIKALTRDDELRVVMEDFLGIDIDKNSELISPPGLDEIWKEDEQPAR
jgi:hypothetical protein